MTAATLSACGKYYDCWADRLRQGWPGLHEALEAAGFERPTDEASK